MRSTIEAIFHTMCNVCAEVWVRTHRHTHVKIYICMRVRWKAYLSLSRLQSLFQAFVMFREKNVLFATTQHWLLTVSLAVQWKCFALNGKNMWKMLGCSNYFSNCSPPYSWSLLCASEYYLIEVFYVWRNPCYCARNMGEYHLKNFKMSKQKH